MFNSFAHNICIILFKVLRLTFLAICCLFYFLIISCSNQPKNQEISLKSSFQISENALNLNTATAEDLEKLPKIGKEIAKKIIEHREKFGKFRRPEHLILVKGMSDKKFREIQTLIKVE